MSTYIAPFNNDGHIMSNTIYTMIVDMQIEDIVINKPRTSKVN